MRGVMKRSGQICDGQASDCERVHQASLIGAQSQRGHPLFQMANQLREETNLMVDDERMRFAWVKIPEWSSDSLGVGERNWRTAGMSLSRAGICAEARLR